MFESSLQKLFVGNSLSFDEAATAMNEIMEGNISQVKLSAWLTALKLKGETADEIGGAASAMQKHCIKIHSDDVDAIDIVGTGGDGAHTFNISTTSVFVAAGAGISVAKHGNRAVSSKSGAADVLTSLGLDLDTSPEKMEATLNKIGLSFLFAQKLHPAMKYIAPVRMELKTRTIFNVLGPLCNPANTKRMVLGVFAPDLLDIYADACLKLGKEHVLIVYGNDSLDEFTTTTTNQVCEIRNGKVNKYILDPVSLGIPKANSKDLVGGTPEENAEITRGILSGKIKGPKRDIVVLNSTAAIIVSGKAQEWQHAIKMAEESIDSGSAMTKLNELVEA